VQLSSADLPLRTALSPLPIIGTPVRDHDGKTYSKKLADGEDAYLIAARLTKEFRSARRGEQKQVNGFSGPIKYPDHGWR
jgi:hypothetical protein